MIRYCSDVYAHFFLSNRREMENLWPYRIREMNIKFRRILTRSECFFITSFTLSPLSNLSLSLSPNFRISNVVNNACNYLCREVYSRLRLRYKIFETLWSYSKRYSSYVLHAQAHTRVHAYGIKRVARLCKLMAAEFYVATIIVGISFPGLRLRPRGEQPQQQQRM